MYVNEKTLNKLCRINYLEYFLAIANQSFTFALGNE